jgi:WD40 repeat protein
VTAELTGEARVWDSFAGTPLTPAMRHTGSVVWAEFSRDGHRIATASRDKTARVWDAATGQALTPPLPHQNTVRCARFSPDGQRLITVSEDRIARLWNSRSGEALTPPFAHNACWVAFSPDGQRVVTAGWDGAARVWDTQSGQIACPPLRHEQSVVFAEFTCDGTRVVTASEDGTARFWDACTGQPLTPILRHQGWVLRVRLNAQETLAATASTDTTARVWDLATGQILLTTSQRSGDRTIEDVQFSPDGQWLATASGDGTARLWDIGTGLVISDKLKHPHRVHTVQFSPDGHRLLTACLRDARVWDLPVLPVPAPAWLPRLAEAVGRRRLNAHRELEPVPVRELLEIRQAIEQSSSTDPYTRWAKWFFADRSTRPQSPNAACTVADHVQRLIDQNTAAALRYALQFSPTNREAFARLANVLRAQNTTSNAAIAAQADWCEHKAKEPVQR